MCTAQKFNVAAIAIIEISPPVIFDRVSFIVRRPSNSIMWISVYFVHICHCFANHIARRTQLWKTPPPNRAPRIRIAPYQVIVNTKIGKARAPIRCVQKGFATAPSGAPKCACGTRKKPWNSAGFRAIRRSGAKRPSGTTLNYGKPRRAHRGRALCIFVLMPREVFQETEEP